MTSGSLHPMMCLISSHADLTLKSQRVVMSSAPADESTPRSMCYSRSLSSTSCVVTARSCGAVFPRDPSMDTVVLGCSSLTSCGSVRATVSFLIRKEKRSPCGPHFPGRSNRWMLCADAHCPVGPGKARGLPKTVLHASFAKSWCPHNCRPLQPTRLATESSNQKADFGTFSEATSWSSRSSPHNSRRVFVLPKVFSLRAGS